MALRQPQRKKPTQPKPLSPLQPLQRQPTQQKPLQSQSELSQPPAWPPDFTDIPPEPLPIFPPGQAPTPPEPIEQGQTILPPLPSPLPAGQLSPTFVRPEIPQRQPIVVETSWGRLQFNLPRRPKINEIPPFSDFDKVFVPNYVKQFALPPPQPTPYEERLYQYYMTDEGRQALMNLMLYAPRFAQRFLTALATVYPMALPPLRQKILEEYNQAMEQLHLRAHQVAYEIWKSLLMNATTEEEEHTRRLQLYATWIANSPTPDDLFRAWNDITSSELPENYRNILRSNIRQRLYEMILERPPGTEQAIANQARALGLWDERDDATLKEARENEEKRLQLMKSLIQGRLNLLRSRANTIAKVLGQTDFVQTIEATTREITDTLNGFIEMYRSQGKQERQFTLQQLNSYIQEARGRLGDLEEQINRSLSNIARNINGIFRPFIVNINDLRKWDADSRKRALTELQIFLRNLGDYGQPVADAIARYFQQLTQPTLTPEVISTLYGELDRLLAEKEKEAQGLTEFGGGRELYETIKTLRGLLAASHQTWKLHLQEYDEHFQNVRNAFNNILNNAGGIISKNALMRARLQDMHARIQQGWARIAQAARRLELGEIRDKLQTLVRLSGLLLSIAKFVKTANEKDNTLKQLQSLSSAANSISRMLSNPMLSLTLDPQVQAQLQGALGQLIQRLNEATNKWQQSRQVPLDDASFQSLLGALMNLANAIGEQIELYTPQGISAPRQQGGRPRQAIPQVPLRPQSLGVGGRRSPVGAPRGRSQAGARAATVEVTKRLLPQGK